MFSTLLLTFSSIKVVFIQEHWLKKYGKPDLNNSSYFKRFINMNADCLLIADCAVEAHHNGIGHETTNGSQQSRIVTCQKKPKLVSDNEKAIRTLVELTSRGVYDHLAEEARDVIGHSKIPHKPRQHYLLVLKLAFSPCNLRFHTVLHKLPWDRRWTVVEMILLYISEAWIWRFLSLTSQLRTMQLEFHESRLEEMKK